MPWIVIKVLPQKKYELNRYSEEKRLDRALEINVLDYWSTNQFRFPNLALMARDVLTIPISTVASESAFSIGGRVLDQYRSCLAHNIVESLICTRDWKFNEQEGNKLIGIMICFRFNEFDFMDNGVMFLDLQFIITIRWKSSPKIS